MATYNDAINPIRATLAVPIPLSGSIMETTLSILFSLPRGSWPRHTAFATPSLYNNGYLLALNQMRWHRASHRPIYMIIVIIIPEPTTSDSWRDDQVGDTIIGDPWNRNRI